MGLRIEDFPYIDIGAYRPSDPSHAVIAIRIGRWPRGRDWNEDNSGKHVRYNVLGDSQTGSVDRTRLPTPLAGSAGFETFLEIKDKLIGEAVLIPFAQCMRQRRSICPDRSNDNDRDAQGLRPSAT
jgi:hypothetical protein